MKAKNFKKLLAFAVSILMLVSIVAIFPVNAVSSTVSYDAQLVNAAAIQIDGKISANEAWNDPSVKYASSFTLKSNATGLSNAEALAGDAKMKLAWSYEGSASAPTAANLYFYMTFVDLDTNIVNAWNGDCFVIGIDELGSRNTATANPTTDSSEWTTATQRKTPSQIPTDSGTAVKNYAKNLYYVVDRNGTSVTVEGMLKFNDPTNAVAGNDIGFAAKLFRNLGTTAGACVQTNWAADPNSNSSGYGKINLIGNEPISAIRSIDRIEPATITLDGKEGEGEAWGDTPWEAMAHTAFTTTNSLGWGGNSEVKYLWGTDDGGDYVYMLLRSIDANGQCDKPEGSNAWMGDVFQIAIDEANNATVDESVNYAKSSGTAGKVHRPGGIFTYASTEVVGGDVDGNWLDYYVVRNGTEVWVEAKVTFIKRDVGVGDIIGLNALAQSNQGTNAYVQITQTGLNVNEFVFNFIEYELKDFEHTVTAKNGDTVVESKKIVKGSEWTLPTATVVGGQLAGWITEDGKLYPVGAKLTVDADITVNALVVDVEMKYGAAVRFEAPTGLRWISYVNDDALDYVKSVGTLITPTEFLSKNKAGDPADIEFTHAGLAAAGYAKDENPGYLDADIAIDGDAANFYGDGALENGAYRFNGTIVNILEANYTRNFSGRGYVVIEYADGSTATFYADYSAEASSRNIADIADAAIADTEADYTADQLAKLAIYAAAND